MCNDYLQAIAAMMTTSCVRRGSVSIALTCVTASTTAMTSLMNNSAVSHKVSFHYVTKCDFLNAECLRYTCTSTFRLTI